MYLSMRLFVRFFFFALLFAAVGIVSAHHALTVLFDTSTTVDIAGEVTEFEFVAPHSYIHLSVTDRTGERSAWQIETYPPGMLIRKGLIPDTLRSGDWISVRGYPTRDGRPLMRLLIITLPNGEERQIQ